MENIYNYTKFTNVSRVKKAVYPLYFTGNIDVSTAVHKKPRKKYRPALKHLNFSYLPTLIPLEGTLGDSKITFQIVYCHRAPNDTLIKNIFNKKGGMAHPNQGCPICLGMSGTLPHQGLVPPIAPSPLIKSFYVLCVQSLFFLMFSFKQEQI